MTKADREPAALALAAQTCYYIIYSYTSVVSRYSTVLGDEDFQLRLPLRDLVLPLFKAYFYLLIYYTTEFPEVPPNLFCSFAMYVVFRNVVK